MAQTCGAKTRSGEPCRKPPLNGKKRCRLHGGKTPETNKNAVSHGIYSSTLSQDEQNQWDGIQLGSVDDELKICRFRLVRALKSENEQGAKLELNEAIIKNADGDNDQDDDLPEQEPYSEKRLKKIDHSGIIDRLMGRIESLEKTRAQLLGGGGGGEDELDGFEVVEYDD